MEAPKGFLATLWNFICFLPYFFGLLLLGTIKGIVFCPLICLIITIVNSSIILGLLPFHGYWTCYSIVRTKLLGPFLKLFICVFLPVVLILWVVVGIVGSSIGGVLYGFLSPIFATFDAVGKGKTNVFVHCFYDGTLSTISGSFTVVRDFYDVCFHSYVSLMEDLRQKGPPNGKYYEIRFLYLPPALIAAVLGFMVDFPVILLIALCKSPYMLYKGWRRLFHDLIGREGPFLETICVPFAGLAILLWPLATVGAVLGSMVSSIFLGAYAGVIVYQESSFWFGLCYVIASLSIYDEYSNDVLDMPEGSCFARPKYRQNLKEPISNAGSLSEFDSLKPHPPARMDSLTNTRIDLKPLELLEGLFKECRRHGEKMVSERLITSKDIEEAKLTKGSRVIGIGLPAYCLLQTLLRSVNNNRSGILLSDNTEITATNRPKDTFFDWFLNPFLILKEQIKSENLSEEEEDYLGKLVLLCGDPERLKISKIGSPPESDRKRAELDAIARRLQGITKSVSRYPTFRRLFENLVNILSEDLAKKSNGGTQPIRRSKSALAMIFSNKSFNRNTSSSEEDLRCSIDEVSKQYPSLIGKSAFIGRVNYVDSETRSCKIWLSESSMVASYLAPGSLVSVSLSALKNKHSNGCPLSSVTDEYTLPFGVGSANETTKEVGNYFALATVFPSCKVLKNGVRLSSSLSYTLGSPSSGSIVFVYPIQSEFQTGLINESEKGHNPNSNCLSLNSCQQLHLELTSKNTVNTSYDIQSKMEFSTGRSHDRFENGITSSPKTPLYQSKLSSLHSAQVDSPFCESSASNISKPNGLCVDSFDVKEILRDESSKKLLETCATSWLYSRNLLRGNIVAIPILSELCIFRVIGAGISNKDLTNGSHHSLPPQTLEPMEHVNSAFVVDHKTEVYLQSSLDLSSETQAERSSPCVQNDSGNVKTIMEHDIPDLGGLSKEYATLKEIISSLVKNALSSFGLQTTKGVLIHGPPGTGKTSLARICVRDAGINLFCVNGPEIVSQYHGESEQELHKVFESAIQAAPSVVFIDELDAIAPARKEGGEQLSQRMVATLLNLMDGVSTTDGVLVIAATNRPDSIEPALRRPGRFDREFEIGVPSPKQRLDILRTLLRNMDHCISDMQVQQLAMATHGFVGADLASLCNEAALGCLRRYSKFRVSCHGLGSCEMPITYVGQSGNNMEGMEGGSDLRDISSSSSDSASSCKLPDSTEMVSQITANIQNGINNNSEGLSLVKENCLLSLVFEDFEKARMKVRPSAMREIILEVPKVNWEDVGGQREVKTQLMEAVEWPQKHQDAFKRIGTRPPTGVLMFGPPGCSKTLMARAVASEAGLNFLAVKGPELFSKWIGESEKAVRSLFAKARANAPSIIFFDEIDSLAVTRGKDNDGVSVSDRVMSQLLVELDGLHQRVDVTVIAATNRPDKIDPALLRPGRFDRLLYVGPPDENDREEIFRIHLSKSPCSSDVSLKELAHLTEGCTGADISLICREAAVIALEESLDAEELAVCHIKTAIRQARPSEIQLYQELSAKFERLVHSSSVEKKLGSQQCSTRFTGFTFWQTVIKPVSELFGGLAKQPS